MITINDVYTAVTTTISQRFPNLRIYEDEMEQGIQAPCFFVKLLPVEQIQELGRRYKRNFPFDIHYYPDPNKDMQMDAHEMAEQLYELMEYITVHNKLQRGIKMKYEFKESVLHFMVEYHFRFMREKPLEQQMQTLKQEGDLINGTI